MPLPPDDLDALVRRREAQARAASEREVARILALPDPAARMAAYAELSRVLAEEGETVPADVADRILRSLRGDGSVQAKEQVVTTWTVERRRLAVMHTLRPIAAAGCAMAALLPFMVSVWRWGWSLGDALTAFLATPSGLLGVALAIVGVGIAGRMAGRSGTGEAMLWMLFASFAAGVAGLAVAGAAICLALQQGSS